MISCLQGGQPSKKMMLCIQNPVLNKYSNSHLQIHYGKIAIAKPISDIFGHVQLMYQSETTWRTTHLSHNMRKPQNFVVLFQIFKKNIKYRPIKAADFKHHRYAKPKNKIKLGVIRLQITIYGNKMAQRCSYIVQGDSYCVGLYHKECGIKTQYYSERKAP